MLGGSGRSSRQGVLEAPISRMNTQGGLEKSQGQGWADRACTKFKIEVKILNLFGEMRIKQNHGQQLSSTELDTQ